jgi:hypothetical protein
MAVDCHGARSNKTELRGALGRGVKGAAAEDEVAAGVLGVEGAEAAAQAEEEAEAAEEAELDSGAGVCGVLRLNRL